MDLVSIFQEEYRALRPRAPAPEVRAEYFPFTGVSNNIRLREGVMRARLSDLLEGAPEDVLRAIAHILLAKLYRKAIDRQQAARYRRYVTSHALVKQAEQLRSLRGRKVISSAQGRVYDLDAIFDRLNRQYFWGLMARPRLTWSRDHARASLGHYDSAHNAIVVSRLFDSLRIPAYAVDYIVFHEMLHLRYPITTRHGRRCVHSREFKAEEKLFVDLAAAKAFLKAL
jgi:predicted metal-dependent hydrolase